MVEWEDSAQPTPNWEHLANFQPPAIVTCASVGWLIHDGNDVKALAPNMGAISEDSAQVSGVIRIPARCVVRIVELEEPDRVTSVALSSRLAKGRKRRVS
jgi:hypothetical protein